MTPESKAPIILLPWYQKRWFKRLAIAVVVILAITGIVAIVMFVAWRNSPERALLEAVNHALETPGSYHITAHGTDLSITLRDQQYAATGTLNDMPIDAIFYGGTLTVKSSQPDELYNFFIGSGDSQQLPPAVQAIAPTIADKWISVNLQNITSQSRNTQMLQCVFQEKESISHDPNARHQWESTYLAHRFLTIQTTKQGSDDSYNVTIDKKARADFFADLQKTSFYQSLTSCSGDADILGSLGDETPLATITITDKHEIKSIVINPASSNPITITANYQTVPTITAPTDATSIDQLIVRYLQSSKIFSN